MLRRLHDLRSRALLDDAAEVHHRDPVGEPRGGREVVRDHQDREALALERVEQRQDAGAHRHVEHRHRLVRDEQHRLENECGGDRHALPLAAGELVRIPVEEELRRRQLDPLERLAHALLALGLRAAEPVDRERLLDRLPDPEPRVERLVGILIHHLDPPAERPQRTHAETGQVAALEADRTRFRVDEPHHRLRGRRLPAAGLADERDHLARGERERHAVDGMHRLVRRTPDRADDPAWNG